MYDNIILGATFYGIGFAIQSPRNILVIERTGLIGSDFVDCLGERPNTDVTVKSTVGKRFKDILVEKRAVADNGDIYLGITPYILAGLLKDNNINIMFKTVVTDIRKIQNGYEVSIYNCDGFSKIKTKRIIDTTPCGAIHDTPADCRKSLNAIVLGENEAFITNGINGLKTFKMPLRSGDTYVSARQKLIDLWKTNKFKNCQIAFIAASHEYLPECFNKHIDDNRFWSPSSSYDNLLQAFDFGAGFAEGI